MNQTTGNETLAANWELDLRLVAITFVPQAPSEPTYAKMDADDDGDIDLTDFAAFQNCLSGPVE